MSPRAAATVLGGFAASAATALLFNVLNLPLPWILGSIVGSVLYTNVVAPVSSTHTIRRSGQLLIGSAVVAVLDAETLLAMGSLLPAMVAVAIFANAVGMALAIPLAHLAGVDRLSALLAALPAGMSEMASLATELNARADFVMVAHSLRVVLVVFTVPLLVGLDVTAGGSYPPPAGGSYTALVACAALGLLLALIADRLNLINPWIIMPMIVGLLIVLAGFEVAPMPGPLLIGAQIAIGFSLGSRLRRADLVRLPRASAAGLGASIVLLACMMLGAWLVLTPLTGLDRASAALSMAPGGLAEMIATAKALGLASAVVASFQFVRSFITNLLAPVLIMRLAGKKRGGKS